MTLKRASQELLATVPAGARWLPAPEIAGGQKLAYERFAWAYTPFWIGVFAVIIVGQLYEQFTAVSTG